MTVIDERTDSFASVFGAGRGRGLISSDFTDSVLSHDAPAGAHRHAHRCQRRTL